MLDCLPKLCCGFLGETAAKRRRMDSSKMDSNKDEAEDSAGDSFGGVMCQGIAQDGTFHLFKPFG